MSQLRKYDFIDALRGWAIIGLVMVHASLMAKPGSPLLATIAGQGRRGLQLFFVASALTLALTGDAGFFVVFPVLLTSAYLISLVTYTG